eukprot:288839_1
MMQTILSMFAVLISITRAQPANDHPCDAQEITSPQVVSGETASTRSADPDDQPSCGATNTYADSVWFHIPGQIKDLTVSTCRDKNGNALNTGFDTKLSIFQPNSCGCINCEDASSFICVDGNGNDE